MLLHWTTPCEKQRKVLSSLGFIPTQSTDQDLCAWSQYGITLEFGCNLTPTIPQVLQTLVNIAEEKGKRIAKIQIREALGVPSVSDLHPQLDC